MSHTTCRLTHCTQPDRCQQLGACASTVDKAHDIRQFVQGDVMPSLRRVLLMIDQGSPTPIIQAELQALLMRARRTV